MKRQHLTPMEALFTVCLIASFTTALIVGRISEGVYMSGIGWLITYAVGKANGYRKRKVEEE